MKVELTMPDWVKAECDAIPASLPNPDSRMREVIRFARLNVRHETGGPFAAGVFDLDSGKLLAMGVNRVVPQHCSSAHAEIMALSLAQQSIGTFDLGAKNACRELVVSARPCAMCMGAVIWSGVRSLVIGSSGEVVESTTGFDEGPLHPQWREELERRDIALAENVLADEAAGVLQEYKESGQLVYNARSAK